MNKINLVKVILLSSVTIGSIGFVAWSTTALSAHNNEKSKTEDINLAAKNIKLDLGVKKDGFKSNNISFSGYDLSKYKVKLLTQKLVNNNQEIAVTYELVDNQNKISSIITKVIPLLNNNDSDLSKVASLVTLDYKNKQDVLAASANNKDLLVSNLDLEKYVFVFKDFKNITNESVDVDFTIKSKTSDLESQLRTIKINGFKAPQSSKDFLDAELKKTVVSYPNKENVRMLNIDFDKLVASGFDKSKLKFELLSNQTNEKQKSITISYRLVDINYPTDFSKTVSKTIDGFLPNPISLIVLNDELKKVTINFPNHQNIIASNAKLKDFTFENYDKTLFEIVDLKLEPNDKEGLLKVSFKLKDKLSNNVSIFGEIDIKGFKNIRISKTVLNDAAKKVIVKYPDQSNVITKNIDDKKFEFSSYDDKKFKISVDKVIHNNTSATVKFKLVDINYPDNQSAQISYDVSGFEDPQLIRDALTAQIAKVFVDYPNKNEILASTTKDNDFAYYGYDKDNFKVSFISAIKNDNNKTATVKFTMISLKDPDISKEIEKVVSGFKAAQLTADEFTEELNKVSVNYTDKEKTLVSKIKNEGFTFSGYDPAKVKPEFLSSTPVDGQSVNVEFQLVDLLYPENKSVKKTIKVIGFKQPPIVTTKLSSLILGNSNGFIKFDETTKNDLDKELKKPHGGVVAFDTTDKIIAVPNGDANLDFSDKKSYIKVGSLTDKFIKGKGGWEEEFEKLMSQQLYVSVSFILSLKIDVFAEIKKLLISPKSESLKLFTSKKPLLKLAPDFLKSKVIFDSKWVETLQNIVNRNNIMFVYNLKTGEFITPISENTKIDVNDPKTYTKILTLTETVRNLIIAKLKELLKTAGIDPGSVDTMLGNEISTYYIFQKDAAGDTISSVWFKQN